MSRARLEYLIRILTRAVAKLTEKGKHDRAYLAANLLDALIELHKHKFGD